MKLLILNETRPNYYFAKHQYYRFIGNTISNIKSIFIPHWRFIEYISNVKSIVVQYYCFIVNDFNINQHLSNISHYIEYTDTE